MVFNRTVSVMDEDVIRKLVSLNSTFYDRFAEPFSDSRSSPQAGYATLLACLPRQSVSVLDVGCGNGRFGRFLIDAGVVESYTGIDSSHLLLEEARKLFPQVFYRDLSLAGCLDNFGAYDLIACLSVLQHIPAEANRGRLLSEMAGHLTPGGRIILANWQFLDSPRQRRKIRPWSEVGIDISQLEPDDYLLTWMRGGQGHRYVAYIDETRTRRLADLAGLRILNHFRSDGLEGNLNLYTVLAR